jgi:hypothetical protein
VFANNPVLGGWRGRSVLRPAYRSWYIKDKLNVIVMQMFEKWGNGIPIGRLPHNATKEQKEEMDKMLKDIHASPTAFIRLINPPPQAGGEKAIDVTTLQGPARTLPHTIEYIRMYDEGIVRSILAMHLMLGGRANSSRSLGSVFIDSFLQALMAWAQVVTDEVNMSIIKPMVIMNDGNTLDRDMPHLGIRNIHGTALRQLAFLAQSGAISCEESVDEFIRLTLGIEESQGLPFDQRGRPDETNKPSKENNAD